MRGFDHLRDSRNQIGQDVMSGTQRHQDGGSIRSRTAGVRSRIPAPRARVRRAGELVMRRLAGRAAVLAGLPILILGLAAGTAAAASGGGQVSNYPCTGTGINEPFGITAGPDGEQALWFTNQGGEPSSTGGSIGEITTSGQCSNYGNSLIDDPAGITAGPDGALWFTNFGSGTGDSIGEITPSGQFTFYTSSLISGPEGITVGPDGALWFTNAGNNTIGRLDPTTGAVTSFSGTGIDDPISITAGPDGEQALWFTNNQNDTIGEITTSGTVSNYTGSGYTGACYIGGPFGITAGPDGALWFTDQAGCQYGTGSIGRMTTSGTLTNLYIGTSIVNPAGITAGPDGALWFTNNGNGTGDSIGRITTSGKVTIYTGTGIDGPEGITAGPDQAVWFTNYSGNSIGRITPPTPQTITFTSTPPSKAVYGGSYTVSATATSGLSVNFSIDTASTAGACSINGSGVVSFTGVGTCMIDANQAGNADWLPAPQAQQSFTIGQAPQTITFTSTPPTSPAFGSTYTVFATGGGSGNPVTFGINPESNGEVCVISGSTVTFIGAGSCIIDASQAGNADYQAANAQQTITVPQETPVLTWAKPANIVHGVPLSTTQLDATASVPGTFTYSPPAGTVLAIGTYTLTATFTPANTTNYTSGGTVSTQITVVKVQVPPCPTCNK
jgi:virginiamycin B lyase